MRAEKSSGGTLRDLVATVAGPRQWGDTRESWLYRAARRSKLNYRTIKAIFYGELTDPNHAAARQLRDAAARFGKTEAIALAERFETVARGLHAADQVFHRADVDALVHAARALRGLGLPGNDRD